MNVPMYQISVDLMNFSFRDQICKKKKKNMNDKKFEKISIEFDTRI